VNNKFEILDDRSPDRGKVARTTLSTDASVTSALLASAGGDRVGVIRGLEPAWPGARAFGPAFTVCGVSGDNLALHRAIAGAPEGVVVVADVQGGQDVAHCGDVLVRAARARGIHGIVLDGSIRDRAAIRELEYPVFHQGTSPLGPTKLVAGELDVPIELLGVTVRPGDVVLADDDGIVVLSADDADEILAAAAAIAEREHEWEARLDAGESTLSILGLAADPSAGPEAYGR
jgi:4-hydroxy-4-methyl-2-oxoglutarate aldolase